MEKVRVGVIGLGNIAQVVHLPILSKMDTVELVAVCDIEQAKAKLVGERYRVKHIFQNYEDMLAMQNLDAVVIATPTNTHKAITIAAARAGKHCLVEKPLARTAKEAKEILDAVSQTKVKVMVGMNQRFRPDAMVMKSFIQNGEIGEVFFVKAGWLKKNPVDRQWKVQKNVSGGGVILDLGIMVLDLALWILNFPKPKSVSAVNFEKQAHDTDSADVEDFSSVLVRLKTGQAISIETGWNFEIDHDLLFCNVYGKDGFARVYPLRFHKKVRDNLVNVTPERIGSLEDIYKRSYQNELKHFIGAVQDLFPVTSTAEEAVERMQIIDAIYKSAKQKKEITL
ncbi:MAG: Gfo/Idh/MocA family oxidoreductase [Chloroherpetonaceae bacterium]|nr:Gfo/Idh/MocA family oxidoreductase [Chloroherpetonaceae bacterium]MCS7210332.1 Gfo/Idh/MocA family oxidoreductase [Chloroherpetonaceae bacterium]MDW8019071.1 Gfo/Idh/MocA family oxidoreductase [Chloroherpetonaceae bacterium]